MDAKFSDAHALGHKRIVHPKAIFSSVTLSRDRATPQGKQKKRGKNNRNEIKTRGGRGGL